MRLKSGSDKTDSNYLRGVQAEKLAVDYLQQHGYRVVQTRYKTKYGEIDIIATRDDLLCFIEVKLRANTRAALESVTARIQNRIERSALYFLAQYPEYCDRAMRFDVIAVTPPFHITHLDNAWEARS